MTAAPAHRRILVATLGDLTKALKLANGPVESPEFTNRIAVIDAAQATASIQSVPRARMEAVENQALQAATGALEEITTRFLFDDDQLPAMLTALNDAVQKATYTVGPLHDVDATHAFGSVELIVQRMADGMAERFGSAVAPPPAPPSEPVAPPAPPMPPATAPIAPPAHCALSISLK